MSNTVDIPHPHRWHDIIERKEDDTEILVGHHCFRCKQTYEYPKLADIGTKVEVTDLLYLDRKPPVQPSDAPKESEVIDE